MQTTNQTFRKDPFGRPVGGGIPLGAVGIIDGDKGWLTAHA